MKVFTLLTVFLNVIFFVKFISAYQEPTMLAPLLGKVDKLSGRRMAVVFKAPMTSISVARFLNNITSNHSSEAEATCGTQLFMDADPQLISEVRLNPMVKYVEYVQSVTAFSPKCLKTVRKAMTWGVGRISRDKPGKSKEYSTWPTGGQGVRVYVIDTGININHVIFGGRAKWAKNYVPNSPNKDEHGHGTCSGGLVADVSRKASIYAVKVLDKRGQGNSEWVSKAICWVKDEAKKTKDKAIMNLSLGGRESKSVDDAVDLAKAAGVSVVVAAGNDGKNAKNYSPARAAGAFTVGASDIEDQMAKFSNFGDKVNMIAPGDKVSCPRHDSNTAKKSKQSGTSFSSPIVAGLLANILTTFDIKKVDDGYNKLKELALKDVVKGKLNPGLAETPNLLANNQCHNKD